MTSVILVQGFYFLFTGIWPIVHMQSFLKITGSKTDLWLVKTVGAFISVIAIGLIMAGFQQAFSPPVIFIAMASAFSLTIIEVVYVYQRVIAPVYLLDAAVESGLLLWWAISLLLARQTL